MHSKAWRVTRAGLFLLLSIALAVLGPTQATGEGCAPPRWGPAETNETKENRDSEKLRERLPGVALNRRCGARAEARREPLPRVLQPADGVEIRPRARILPNPGSDPYHEFMKLKHSPAVLQVVRH
ncbi:hypothetical protein SAMN02982929_03343 [Saccharopolyspora kobensis]|uniref:Uncharacterized protein n=1 Tax=Saccharopolyspora kobensis TaxID=146035 RepID=A0A1H6CDQ8_9PSEU|nr:hypothetical protein [Saccharopolyspora kobensis]SEG71038.1 hypothetical protein SAMN02982929_03343 [Saccharopolyspora kobensis]SFC36701.1 hypothetical protein SAMN05216506_101585 [Saccharopolyspora kobensis]